MKRQESGQPPDKDYCTKLPEDCVSESYFHLLGRPLRVLMGSHNLHWEGAPRSLLEIATGLNAGAHLEIEILAPCDGPLRAHYEADGISVTIKELAGCFNVVQGWPSRERYETAKREIEHVLNRMRPDVVIANTLHSFYLVDAATRAGIPAIWIIHESYSMEVM